MLAASNAALACANPTLCGFVDAPWNPYQGLPVGLQLALLALLALALLALVSAIVLMVQGVREHRSQRRAVRSSHESDFLWVYMVPALDEEVTIADSVSRIVDVDASNKIMLVIDDGSTDRTPEILAELQAQTPGLHVLRRDLPNARNGKSAGLDDAWRHLHEHVLEQPEYAHWPTDRIIVGVVDADGRIATDAPQSIVGAFADERVGGVQSLVRIYNRGHLLTWAQHLEFAIMAYVYQLGRSRWGTANMGGNGQYMRLAALDDLAVDEGLPRGIAVGPWRDRLTEDQDIGIRMMRAGWRGAQTVLTAVEQQGLTNVRRLLRQRIRWAQGAWQSVPAMGSTGQLRASGFARIDHAIYLLMPAMQMLMGLGLVVSLWLVVVAGVPLLGGTAAFMAGFVVLALAPLYLALVIVAPGGWLRPLVALAYLVPYLAYTWLVWPAFTVGLVRELLGVRGWAKTAREPIDAHLAPVTNVPAVAAMGAVIGLTVTASIAMVSLPESVEPGPLAA